MGFFSNLFGGDGITITAAEALERYNNGDQLIDVRQKHEWNSGHPRGAKHIPLASLATSTKRLRKNTPVLLICASGMRSKQGARTLRGLGYEAYSVKGGVGAWKQAGGAIQ